MSAQETSEGTRMSRYHFSIRWETETFRKRASSRNKYLSLLNKWRSFLFRNDLDLLLKRSSEIFFEFSTNKLSRYTSSNPSYAWLKWHCWLSSKRKIKLVGWVEHPTVSTWTCPWQDVRHSGWFIFTATNCTILVTKVEPASPPLCPNFGSTFQVKKLYFKHHPE